MDRQMQDALNAQLNRELAASHLYLSMTAYFEAEHLPGFAHWMHEQSEEEREHALRFFAHIHERGGRVTLAALDAPQGDFASPEQTIARALAHEQEVTRHIHDLVRLAQEQGELASERFLDWFVHEQVEEEKVFASLLQDVQRIGDDGTGLFLLDRELSHRQGDE